MFLRKAQLIIITASMVLIPLVYWHGVFFPYTFVKTIVFYVLTELACVLWIVLAVRQKEYRARISLVSISVAVFLALVGITSLTGVDSPKSIWSDYERMLGFVTWLHLGGLFIILVSAVRKEREWNMVFNVMAGCASFIAAVAVWQGFTTEDLSISTIGNAAYLSSYLVPSFFLVCMLALREERVTWRVWAYMVSLFLFIWALIYTEARAGIVGLAVGGGIGSFLFLFFGDLQGHTFSLSHRFLKKVAAVLFIVGIAASIFIVAFPKLTDSVVPHSWGQLFDFNIQERTASARLLVWRVAWEGWKEHALFGWGPENFAILFNAHYAPELYFVEPWFDRAHNFLFDYGSTMGLAGLLAYVGMFGAAVFAAVRQWKGNNLPFGSMAMLVALLGAHLTQNLFTFDILSSLLVVVSIFAYLAHCRDNVIQKPVVYTRYSQLPVRSWVIGCAGVIVIGYVGYATVVKSVLANAAAHRGWELLRTGGGDNVAVAEFEKSISYGTPYSVDARRFAAEYVFEFLKKGGKRPAESLQRLMNYTIEKMTENIAAEPENVKWVMYRGELYSLMAQKFDASFAKKAEEDFFHARDMSPGRPQIYLELAQARKLQGDMESAWKYIDYVIDTVPNFSFGHLNALNLAIETGNTVREAKEYKWLSEKGELRNEIIRDIYFKKQRYTDAIKIQEIIVRSVNEDYKSSPAYRAIFYAHLAALYQYANDVERARLAAYKVVELDPTKKNEVEAFLRALP